MGRLMLVLFLIAGLVILDQASKAAVRGRFLLGEGIALVPGLFDLHYVQNTGAAWGLFAGFSHWLVVVSIVMLVVLVVFRRSIMTDALIHRCASALMIGGIVGNLIDRVRLGYVVDFLDFYWLERGGSHHFPAFNVADSAICVGVGLYILTQFWPRSAVTEEPAACPAPVGDPPLSETDR